jgi:Predicted acid phosphatase
MMALMPLVSGRCKRPYRSKLRRLSPPDRPLSGCSHQLSRGQTLTIDQRGTGEYAIGGTPADCTRVAVGHLYPQAPMGAVGDQRWGQPRGRCVWVGDGSGGAGGSLATDSGDRPVPLHPQGSAH